MTKKLDISVSQSPNSLVLFQAPQRLARDKNLSVISSPSILESVQQSSGDGGSQGYTQLTQLSSLAPPPPSPPHSTLPLEAEEKVATSSSSDTPLCSGNGHAQQTTPTSHMGTPSIHMTLEDHQRQLQTLQDEVVGRIIAGWCRIVCWEVNSLLIVCVIHVQIVVSGAPFSGSTRNKSIVNLSSSVLSASFFLSFGSILSQLHESKSVHKKVQWWTHFMTTWVSDI